jgi:hypothetical protein
MCAPAGFTLVAPSARRTALQRGPARPITFVETELMAVRFPVRPELVASTVIAALSHASNGCGSDNTSQRTNGDAGADTSGAPQEASGIQINGVTNPDPSTLPGPRVAQPGANAFTVHLPASAMVMVVLPPAHGLPTKGQAPTRLVSNSRKRAREPSGRQGHPSMEAHIARGSRNCGAKFFAIRAVGVLKVRGTPGAARDR